MLNQGADALSRRNLLLLRLNSCMLSFEHLKSLYPGDLDVAEQFEACQVQSKGDFVLQVGSLFNDT